MGLNSGQIQLQAKIINQIENKAIIDFDLDIIGNIPVIRSMELEDGTRIIFTTSGNMGDKDVCIEIKK